MNRCFNCLLLCWLLRANVCKDNCGHYCDYTFLFHFPLCYGAQAEAQAPGKT